MLKCGWASSQSDQGLPCLLTDSLDITESMNGGPGRYFVHVQDDLNLHILHMFEGIFLHDATHLNLILYILEAEN